MENTVQENPVPDTSEKEQSLEKVAALGQNIADSYKSIRVVGVMIAIAALSYIFAVGHGWGSPFIFPALLTVSIGNQMYITRTRKKEVKLAEIKKSHESKFGVIPSI